MSKGTTKKQTQTRDKLLELEHAFWDAMKDRNGKSAAKLTDDSCIVIGPQGIGEIDAAKIEGMIENAPYEMEAYGLDKDRVRFKMVDDDVAIVAYEVDEQMVVDGQKARIKAYDSSVWVRKDKRWVCAMHTETIAGDPYGRDRQSQS